jgi:Met-zincin/Domain of unknown function (DUF5117)
MSKLTFQLCCILSSALPFWALEGAMAQVNIKPKLESSRTAQTQPSDRPELPPDIGGGDPTAAPPATPSTDTESFDTVIQNTRKLEGLFTLYKNDDTGELYLEVSPKQLNQNYLLSITLSRGIGEAGLLSGMPLGDVLFQFRRVRDRVQFVLPNLYLRNRPDDPTTRSGDRSFSESILATLTIKATHPETGTILLDVSDLFIQQDLSGLTEVLPWILGGSYTPNPNTSYFTDVKTFPMNVEVESVYGFSGSGGYLETLPDSRSFSLGVHYSLSELPPKSAYQPRTADERVGYFITAYQNLADDTNDDPFVRNIQRWHLEKQDPSAELSPPKEPIVFWIENTVPPEYRDAIRDGALLWNKAFEQAGFLNAIEVRQMPDNAEWKPEDIRYNTIRWSTSFRASFSGFGPSRVNPLTGEILDADILIDAGVLRFAEQEFETYVGMLSGSSANGACNSLNASCNGDRSLSNPNASLLSDALPGMPPTRLPITNRQGLGCSCPLCTMQFQMGISALTMLQGVQPDDAQIQEYIKQYLRYLTAHEVGHTLGLRHNFHGSTALTPEQLNDPSITRTQGMVSSVMDYVPANIAPPGVTQGDFFPTGLGTYDEWAIEYGYKTTPSGRDEVAFLDEIAQRASQPEHAYGTDEDAWVGTDPEVVVFDLSNDPVKYARIQMENARQMWSRLDRTILPAGEDYSELRQKFNWVLMYYFNQALTAMNYIGGQSFNRDRVGDPGGRLPFASVPAAKQRESLALLSEYVFAPSAFEFSPELLNQLAPSRWSHWGSNSPSRLDYPIHDIVLRVQSIVLQSLLSGDRLSRLRDLEVKTAPEEALTLPELFDSVQQSIWLEVLEAKDKKPEISSFRRSLQREHLNLLIAMVLRQSDVPEDARTLAWYELRQLDDEIRVALRKRGDDLDTYTKAHLEETRDRLLKALDAQIQSN